MINGIGLLNLQLHPDVSPRPSFYNNSVLVYFACSDSRECSHHSLLPFEDEHKKELTTLNKMTYFTREMFTVPNKFR